MNYFEQGLNWFQTQNKRQKISLASGLVLIFTLTTALIYWVLSPSYGVLFNHLDSQDANQILTQLEQANIPYQVRNHGSEILIDTQVIDKTRIKLMGSDLGLAHSVGFELFDKTDFGMTDFSQKINFQRALQGELERTISSLEEIKKARVQLVIPETHLFQEANNLPRAAVTLHLNRALTPQQVKSIQQLITASVAHLPLSNVVIVDQNGNGLTPSEEDGTSSHFNAKKSVERYLSDKVMHMLASIFNQEQVMVKIDATLNYDELQRELIKPRSDGLITHEKEVRHSSNINKTDKQPGNQDITHEKSYELGQEKERYTRANGTIDRLTVSVVLPQNTTPEKISQIERVVKSIVGFNANRGDIISVEALIVEPTPAPTTESMIIPRSPWPKSLFYWGAFGMGLLLIASTIVHRRKRLIKRQQLLTELNQWLIEHG